jgi:hypothetical protein
MTGDASAAASPFANHFLRSRLDHPRAVEYRLTPLTTTIHARPMMGQRAGMSQEPR